MQFKIFSLNKKVSNQIENNIYIILLKLPMIIEPKSYNYQNLEKFLLNHVETIEKLIIDKANYKKKFKIDKNNNIIYAMANNMNKTLFKVNKVILHFILFENIEYDKIANISKKYKYANIKRNKRQKKIFRINMSKIIPEQNILGIVFTYENIPSIYFLVRLN